MLKVFWPIGLFMVFAGSSAQAVEAKFIVEQGLVSYSALTNSTKPENSDTQISHETKIETMPNDLYVEMMLDRLNFFLYPTQEATPLGISYYFLKDLEIGVSASLNQTNVDKPKSDTADNSLGFWATYYLEIGKSTFEFVLPVSASSGKSDTNTTVNTSSLSISPGVNFVHFLGQNVAWVCGAVIEAQSSTQKDDSGTTKNSASGIRMNLTSFRFYF